MDNKKPFTNQPFGNRNNDSHTNYNDPTKYYTLTKLEIEKSKAKIQQSRQNFFSRFRKTSHTETTQTFNWSSSSEISESRKNNIESSFDRFSPTRESLPFGNISINMPETKKPPTAEISKLLTNGISYQSPYTNRIFSANNIQPVTQPGPRLSYTSTSSPKTSPNLISPETKVKPQKLNLLKKEKLEPAEYHIFNNHKFDKIDHKFDKIELGERKGSKIDAKRLKETFKKFNLKGDTHENLKLKQLKSQMEKLSKKNFSKKSAIVIAILSHGMKDSQIFAKDGIFSLYDDIIEPLSKNQTLNNKPKIIFVEACKGTKDLRWQADTNSTSDVLVFNATFENNVSYTHPVTGSYFTQSLCQKIEELGKFQNIRDICDAVIDDVKTKYKEIQVPTMMINLTQRYCFGDFL